MSLREPDHLPNLPNYWDAPEPTVCMECDGSGEVDCGRDWQVMKCEHCSGTGYEPDEAFDPYVLSGFEPGDEL